MRNLYLCMFRFFETIAEWHFPPSRKDAFIRIRRSFAFRNRDFLQKVTQKLSSDT